MESEDTTGEEEEEEDEEAESEEDAVIPTLISSARSAASIYAVRTGLSSEWRECNKWMSGN